MMVEASIVFVAKVVSNYPWEKNISHLDPMEEYACFTISLGEDLLVFDGE